ncbi:PTS system, nitrogen regulatory IIA component [Stigmatella aurantiaca]|uniref:PTS system, nitrogen regulatory IIA component n=1 Tax=Stigmatella aurantiaca TaxID=41 RepID=A0A1H7P3I7_STIAU|nr:PTS sugar transporter subunit IIA [Stigmatella aurantiaca]SEL30353.1 PTS system, nitrogen regulatory IIA component [Stigmatella aurantiaca]
MHVGATLRLLRVEAGLSLRDLAKRIGVSSAYLSRVEHGLDAVPTPARISAIARELDIPPTLLMDVAHRVSPFLASYLEQEPAASQLFLEIARRQLNSQQLTRLRQLIHTEFPSREFSRDEPPATLAPLLSPERLVLQLSCARLDDALDVAAGRLASAVPGTGAGTLAARLLRSEEEVSSAVGNGVAVPRVALAGGPAVAALVTLARPLPAETPDGQPVRLVVALMSPERGRPALMRLAHVARLASQGLADRLAEVQHPHEVLQHLQAMEPLA